MFQRGISQNQTDTARVSYSENISFFYSYLKHCLPLTWPSQGDGHDKKELRSSSTRIYDDEELELISQSSIDEIQEKLDHLYKEGSAQLEDILYLVSRSGIYPSELELKNVTCTDRRIYGMGRRADVYRGKWERKEIAMKHLRVFHMVQPSQRPELKKAFLCGAVNWKSLSHANILPFLGLIDSAELGGLCMVSPWYDAGTIRQYLDRVVERDGSSGSPFTQVVDKSLREISQGLAYLHAKGIVHGDLRGANILIDDDHNARLADVGVIEITDQARDYPVLDPCGTAAWQAPERLDPEEFGLQSANPTSASDIYAFGSVCVELYTRQNPFPGQREIRVVTRVLKGIRPERPSKVGEGMSDPLWSLVTQTWVTDPKDRPSAERVAHTLANL